MPFSYIWTARTRFSKDMRFSPGVRSHWGLLNRKILSKSLEQFVRKLPKTSINEISSFSWSIDFFFEKIQPCDSLPNMDSMDTMQSFGKILWAVSEISATNTWTHRLFFDSYNSLTRIWGTVTSPRGTGPQLLNLPNIEKLEKKFSIKKFGKKTFGTKKLWKKFSNDFFQLQVAIPSARPTQLSSRSDYCISLS